MLASEIIRKPLITEKSMQLVEKENKYTFEVDKRANKIQIKQAIEELFKVTVTKVNIINTTPKKKRVGRHEGYKPQLTKAVVTLKAEDKIEIFSS